jgi:hypothetical protein
MAWAKKGFASCRRTSLTARVTAPGRLTNHAAGLSLLAAEVLERTVVPCGLRRIADWLLRDYERVLRSGLAAHCAGYRAADSGQLAAMFIATGQDATKVAEFPRFGHL